MYAVYKKNVQDPHC